MKQALYFQSEEEFQSFCSQLFHAEFPMFQSVEGAGGDGGSGGVYFDTLRERPRSADDDTLALACWEILVNTRVMAITRRFHVYLRPEPEGGYTAIVPALPGCVTYGRDVSEARAMADDAIRAYIASLRKHGEPVPKDADALLASVDVPVRG